MPKTKTKSKKTTRRKRQPDPKPCCPKDVITRENLLQSLGIWLLAVLLICIGLTPFTQHKAYTDEYCYMSQDRLEPRPAFDSLYECPDDTISFLNTGGIIYLWLGVIVICLGLIAIFGGFYNLGDNE